MDVSFKGIIKNGVVVLPPEADLPEGAQVEVTPVEKSAENPSFRRTRDKSGIRQNWRRRKKRFVLATEVVTVFSEPMTATAFVVSVQLAGVSASVDCSTKK